MLTADLARRLLDSIDTSDIIGLRDRALIGVMVCGFARVSATVGILVEDYLPTGKRWWFRRTRRAASSTRSAAHHHVEAYVGSYIQAESTTTRL